MRVKRVRRVGVLLVAAGRLAVVALPWALAGFLVLMVVSAALPVAVAWLTRSVVDGLAGVGGAGVGGAAAGRGGGAARLVWPAGGLALAGVAAAAAPAGLRYLRNEMERAITLLAKERLFIAVDRINGLARFEDPKFLDRLELADESGGRGPNHVVDGTAGLVAGILTVAGFLGALLVISVPMALLVLASGVPLLLAELALSRHRARTYWEITPAERRELFYRNLLATEGAAKEVRLFALGGFLRGRMLAERRQGDLAERRMDRRELRTQIGLGALSAGVAGGGLVWAVVRAGTGTHSVGDIALFIAAVIGVQAALTSVVQQVARVHEALLLFEHYVQIVEAAPDLPVAPKPAALSKLERGIELRDVWFRYSDQHDWVLRGVDLLIPQGRTLALVGLNGAGKSTLVKLLCRFYDPTKGQLLWDGVDIREAAPEDLRGRISAVFQDYVDYEMTAADSIAMGDLSALDDRSRVRTAADRAGVGELLSGLPQGYDTLLSRQYAGAEVGVELSGGQRQRLALARAFLRESRDLVILDEPSSGLDAAAEHEIHRRLKEHRRGLTSVLISHRLNAIRDADVIVTLAGGRIVERGSHDQLIAAQGEYARLFELQAHGYQD